MSVATHRPEEARRRWLALREASVELRRTSRDLQETAKALRQQAAEQLERINADQARPASTPH